MGVGEIKGWPYVKKGEKKSPVSVCEQTEPNFFESVELVGV